MTLEKNRAEFWGLEEAESSESEKPQGFSVSWGKMYWSTIDANGNELASQQYNYSWDAANRLVGITSINPTPPTLPDNITFTYDGFGRRVGIVESHGSTVLTSKTFVWVGGELCQERDGTGSTVTKQFFAQGERIGTINYFYTLDHLGSVREMTDSNGVVHAKYDYDLYGRQTKLSGDMDADFGYTGFFMERAANLELTLFRAYDAEKGRWLNRDPLRERAGLNLYSMVDNNPLRWTDYLGLCGGGGGGNMPNTGNPSWPPIPNFPVDLPGSVSSGGGFNPLDPFAPAHDFFYGLLHGGGPYDWGTHVLPQSNQYDPNDPHFYQKVQLHDLGNVNFGIYMAAAGYPEWFAQDLAALLRPLGNPLRPGEPTTDLGNSQRAASDISNGYNYYNNLPCL